EFCCFALRGTADVRNERDLVSCCLAVCEATEDVLADVHRKSAVAATSTRRARGSPLLALSLHHFYVEERCHPLHRHPLLHRGELNVHVHRRCGVTLCVLRW